MHLHMYSCTAAYAGNHPNIVEVLGMYYTNDERGTALNLVMEYVPKVLLTVLGAQHWV